MLTRVGMVARMVKVSFLPEEAGGEATYVVDHCPLVMDLRLRDKRRRGGAARSEARTRADWPSAARPLDQH
jgi:hypothetical protein